MREATITWAESGELPGGVFEHKEKRQVLTVGGTAFRITKTPCRVESEDGKTFAALDPGLRRPPISLPDLSRGVTVETQDGPVVVSRPRFGFRLRDRSLVVEGSHVNWTIINETRRKCSVSDAASGRTLAILHRSGKMTFAEEASSTDISLIALIDAAAWPWTASLLYYVVQGISF